MKQWNRISFNFRFCLEAHFNTLACIYFQIHHLTFLCEKKNHLSLRHSRLGKRKTKICHKLISEYCFITEGNTLSKFSSRNQLLVHSLCCFSELHPSRHRRIHYNEFCSRKSNYHLKVLHIQGLNKLFSILVTSKPGKKKHRRSFSFYFSKMHIITAHLIEHT